MSQAAQDLAIAGLRRWHPEWDLERARQELARRTRGEADCILRKERPFSREEIGRRRPLAVLAAELAVASAEDVILSKLEWSRESGGSERQRRDVAAILAGAGDGLDQNYLRRWRGALGLELDWALATGTDKER